MIKRKTFLSYINLNFIKKLYRVASRILKSKLIQLRIVFLNEDAVKTHFRNWALDDHINKEGFEIATKHMNKHKPIILETGTSAYGVDSTRLLDLLALKFKGNLISVDISPKPKNSLRYQLSAKSSLYVKDSVLFIQEDLKAITTRIDFCYLDSWDVDWSNPEPSELHGLAEFTNIEQLLNDGAVILIDDTPQNLSLVPKDFRRDAERYQSLTGRLPGKGSLILARIKEDAPNRFDVIYHGYNLVLKFNRE
jgi:hypothetical protein